MGTWGPKTFENDIALDWLIDLSSAGITGLSDALKRVAERKPDDYVEAPDCCEALAAAEIVAARSNPQELPDEAQEWLSENSPLESELLECVFRLQSNAQSGRNRMAIPGRIECRFRS